MNLVLFEEEEIDFPLPYADPRSIHIETILSLKPGDSFEAGIIGGMVGHGRLSARGADGWNWSFIPVEKPDPPRPIILVLGCPRPPVARRLLKDMTAMGIREMRFCKTDLNEKSYLESKLWITDRWRRAVIEGASQGFTTILPAVRRVSGLEGALDDLPTKAARVVLDPGADSRPFGLRQLPGDAAILAVGPERGWSDREAALLVARGFAPVTLGPRRLRTETACAVGAGLMLAGMNHL